MIVEFKRNGRQTRMNDKIARVLLKKGVIRIVSEDAPKPATVEVPAAPVAEIVPVAEVVESTEPAAEITAPSADGLDEMDRDQVLQFAKELGIRIHGGTGVEKAREIIREHTK